jgi:hypothetical protein
MEEGMTKKLLVVTFAFSMAFVTLVPFSKSVSAQAPKPVLFTADITFGQEAYARPTTTPSTAVGAGMVLLSADRTKVSYAVIFLGTSGPISAAHFHSAGSYGINAGVVKNICTPTCDEGRLYTGEWTLTDATQPLTQAIIDALLAGQVYINVHTAMNPGGEIRGQVVPVSAK